MLKFDPVLIVLVCGLAANPAVASGKKTCAGDASVLIGGLENISHSVSLSDDQCLCFDKADFKHINIDDQAHWRISVVSEPGVSPVRRGICPLHNAQNTRVSLIDVRGGTYFLTLKAISRDPADSKK